MTWPRMRRAPRWPEATALLLLTGTAAVVQIRVVPVPDDIDAISLGMAVLALSCAILTLLVTPSGSTAERWRWLAAIAGWLAWTGQWLANTVEASALDGRQFAANVLVIVSRIAFITALVPLAGPDEPKLLRWLDAGMGALLASLLALLSWPDLADGITHDPDRFFLYLGYGAMAGTAAMSFVTQRSAEMRLLTCAMLWALLCYGIAGIGLREAFAMGRIGYDSAWFLAGDLAFVAYLALLRRPSAPLGPDGQQWHGAATGMVPLLLAILIISLAFAIMPVRPAWAIVAGVGALVAYAARTTLTWNHHRMAQDRAIAVERERSRTMIDFMHEVRSPLGAVSLNAVLLGRSRAQDETQASICAAIEAGCTAVSDLLDDMLALERVEAGLIPPEMASHDIAEIARDVVALLGIHWRAAQVDVVAPGGSFTAVVDRGSVHRILLNLVDNAVRFTPAGGRVVIDLERDARNAVVSIADTGVGLTPEQQDVLFQRFAIVGQPLHGRHGTGLGLSISLALARAMNGSIAVRSRRGQGTTMSVSIPQCAGIDVPKQDGNYTKV